MHWNAEALWETVEPLLTGFSIEVLPEIDSTNTELMRRARAGQHDPVLLVAERQTAGRGRLGRDWQGAPGLALAFSLGLPLTPPDWSGLSLTVGLSVANSLHPSLQLKWPNDVWLGERKLAGILIETALFGDTRYAVIGIGINIGTLDGQGMRTPPAALVELLPDMTAPLALQQVVPALVADLQAFARHGFGPWREQFHSRDLLYGREIECTDGTSGTARGVDAAGALLVHTASGLQKITSAEVSVRPGPPPKPAT
jgi:BirA family biotin operon repressor/biotin-[acetyl-CoA-carboxylase] ligase